LLISFVKIKFGLGPLTLNELTPEEAAQYMKAAQRHSSRGSIPVMVEEPNIIPTPDDESENGSEEENEVAWRVKEKVKKRVSQVI
jgi:hypothetical protein